MKRLSVALLVLLAGCGRGAADPEFADATPAELDAIALELSGHVSEGALTSEDGIQRQGLGEPGELLATTRQRIKALNDAVRAVVTPIAELIAADQGKAPVGADKVFGPKTKNGIDYRLTVHKVSATRFGWKLEAKATADTAYQLFAGGMLVKGEQPHRGRGALGIDLDVLRGIDATLKPQGKVFCGFAHVGDTKTLIYRLRDFTPDVAAHPIVSGVFAGHRLMPSRATAVRLIARQNLGDSPTTAPELIRARARFVPGVGGRADILATEGDVPAGKVYFGSACWDAQEKEGFAILRLCDQGAPSTCQVIATRGMLSNCKLNEQLPPAELDDASVEPEAPATDVVVPAVMPSGSGE